MAASSIKQTAATSLVKAWQRSVIRAGDSQSFTRFNSLLNYRASVEKATSSIWLFEERIKQVLKRFPTPALLYFNHTQTQAVPKQHIRAR